jgi:hypothetical protein
MNPSRRDRLQRALEACVRVGKSPQGEFSAKWLRYAGTPVSGPTLTQLCDVGCLAFTANGIVRPDTRWYRVLRLTLPD